MKVATPELEKGVNTPREFLKFVEKNAGPLFHLAVSKFREDWREPWTGKAREIECLARANKALEKLVASPKNEFPCYPKNMLLEIVHRMIGRPSSILGEGFNDLPGSFIKALAHRATFDRDALVASFYHQYGYTSSEICSLLHPERKKNGTINKNLQRWKISWEEFIKEAGIDSLSVKDLENSLKNIDLINDLVLKVQKYYRGTKQEYEAHLDPKNYRKKVEYEYHIEYHVWHLAYCLECTEKIYDHLSSFGDPGFPPPRINYRFLPMCGRDPGLTRA